MVMPQLGQIGTRDVITLPKESTVLAAASLMEEHNIRDVIVVFGDGDYRIFDVRELLAYRIRSDDFKAPLAMLELKKVPTISEEADVLEGIALIRDRCEHICLLDAKGELSGIVSYSDLLATLDPKVLAESRQLGEVLVGTKFCSAPAEMKVGELFERMHATGHSEAIVTEKGHPVGIMTRGDIIKLLAREDALEGTVGDAASKPLVGVPDTMNIQDAIIFSKAKHFKRIVVQDSKGEVLGVISQKDLVTLFYNRWSYFLTEQREELKRLNDELQSRKETLERITDTMGEGLYVMDQAGVITHCNESMARILGYTKEELLGQVAHELFHAHFHNHNLPLVDCPIYRTIQNRRAYEGVEEFIKKDGQVIQVRVTSHPLIKNDRVTGSVSTFSDITQEVAMHEQVRQREAWFRGLFDLSPDGIVIIDPETTGFREFNRAAYENLGYTKEEFAGLNLESIDALEEPRVREKRIRQILETGRADFDTLQRTKEGRLKPVMVSVQSVSVEKKTFLMATWRDISEQVKAREQIAESEAWFRGLFDLSPDGIVILDPATARFRNFNRAAYEMLGYTEEEYAELTVPDIDLFDDQERAERRAREAMEKGRSNFETRHRKKDGSTIPVLVSIQAMVLGENPYMMVTFRDVSEEVKARELIERERNLFAAGPVAVFEWYPEAGWPVYYVTPNVIEVLGYSAEEMQQEGFHFAELLHPEDIEQVGREVDAHLAKRTPRFEQSYRLRCKDGVYRWFYDFTVPQWEGDKIVKIRGYLVDQSRQKEVEASLALERRRLTDILDGTRTGTWEWSVQTGETVFNERWAEIIGYRLEELEPISIETWSSLVHPDDAKISEALLTRHFARETDYYECECRMKHKDGSWVWVLDRGRVVEWDREGRPILMSGTHTDITERKMAEIELQEQERMLHTIYDVLPVGITITDPEGNIVDCNAASETLLGITREEHLHRNYAGKEWHIIRPDGSPMPAGEYASVRALKEGHTVRDVEMGIVREAGTVWLSVSAMPVEDPRFGVVVAYADITERREYEIKLRDLSERLAEQVEYEVQERLKNEAKYRNLFNAVPDAIIVHGFDANGLPTNFMEVNDRACELFGVDRETLLTFSPQDIRPAGEDPERVKELARELLEKGMVELEELIRRPDGTERTIQRLSVYQQIGKAPVVFTVMRDITDKKRLEREHEMNRQLLVQQSKMAEMGSMVGIIAHQWKQPLNSIALIVQDIADSFDYGELDKAMVHSHVEKAMQQVEFMGKTIDDFRNFFKPSKVSHRFKLTQCVNETVALIKPQLEKYRILTVIEGDSRYQVAGYENELKQVILNIVNNAKDALVDNGIKDPYIEITVVKEGEQAILTIRDNAGGIPEQLLPDKLFETFASTKGEKGTGVGLSLARQIVAKMEGTIVAYNENEGAVFKITLPCAGKDS